MPVFPPVPNSSELFPLRKRHPILLHREGELLTPGSFVVLTQSCRHSTPEPPWDFSVVPARGAGEAPGHSLIVFGQRFCSTSKHRSRARTPVLHHVTTCSSCAAPGCNQQRQQEAIPLQTSPCSLQGPASPSRKPGPSLQSWPRALAGLYRSQFKAQELGEPDATGCRRESHTCGKAALPSRVGIRPSVA